MCSAGDEFSRPSVCNSNILCRIANVSAPHFGTIIDGLEYIFWCIIFYSKWLYLYTSVDVYTTSEKK
jgi:hypothetical protein